MPYVYVPDSVYAPAHHHQPQYSAPHYQPYHSASSPYAALAHQQPQAYIGAPTPQPTPSPYFHHSSPYQPQHSAAPPLDPTEAHKQRLLAEFAQCLDQHYTPAPHHSHHRHSLATAPQPSAESARIQFLEEQLRAEKEARRKLAERGQRKALAKEAAKREKQQVEEQQQLYLRYLQHQQEQRRRRVAFVEDRPAPTPARHRRVDEEQLVALLQAQQQRPQPQPQPRTQEAEQPSVNQLAQLFALAQMYESRQAEATQAEKAPEVDTPTPAKVAYHYIPHPSVGGPTPAPTPVASSSTKPASSSPKPSESTPAPASTPLAALRLLQSRLNLLLSSNTLPASAALEKLLVEADGLESGGDEEVRAERRRFVKEVEKELGKLEREEESKMEGSPVVIATEPEETKEVEGYAVPEVFKDEEKEEEDEEVKEEDVEEVAKVDKGKGKAVRVEDEPEESGETGGYEVL